MNFEKDDFCRTIDQCSIQNIVNILSKYFGFSDDLQSILIERYAKMYQNFLDVPHNDIRWNQGCNTYSIIDKKDALLAVDISNETGILGYLKQYYNIGVDLPVWFTKNNPKKKIMIIAQDPQRSGHNCNQLILSTPWGLHSYDFANTSATSIKNVLNNLVIEQNYAVYITDCTKFYFTTEINSKKPYLTYNKRKKILEKFEKNLQSIILKKEIEIFNPDVIITLGEQVIKNNYKEWRITKDLYSNMIIKSEIKNNLGRPLITLYHPSGLNYTGYKFIKENFNGSWKEYFNVKLKTLFDN